MTPLSPLGQSGSEPYDSREDTLEHIRTVQRFLRMAIRDLEHRALMHDDSKLGEPEKSVFDEYTPKLRDSTYGSDEYKAFLAGMGAGLAHHYEVNDHHPEHFAHGIKDMDLIQVIEMLADWKAATLRHADGSLARSIAVNHERFGYGIEMHRLLWNTAERLGWLEPGSLPDLGEITESELLEAREDPAVKAILKEAAVEGAKVKQECRERWSRPPLLGACDS